MNVFFELMADGPENYPPAIATKKKPKTEKYETMSATDIEGVACRLCNVRAQLGSFYERQWRDAWLKAPEIPLGDS